MELDLSDRIALVTGASRGIGRSAALALAKAGAQVIALARTKGGLEELDDEIRTATGQSATLVPLNLKHASKVDAIGPSLFQRFGRLDILVANAGVLGPLSPLGHIRDDDWAETLDLNLTTNWRLIRTLDPLLKRSDAGRAIFVTSGAAQKARAYWGPYSASKAALDALVKTYAHEVENTPIRVNLLNPGPVATNMRAKAYPGEKAETITQPDALGPWFTAMSAPAYTANAHIVSYDPAVDPATLLQTP